MLNKQPTIGIVIPTLNAEKHLPHCLPQLLLSPLKPRVLVLDSSSSDSTVEQASRFGAETLVIPREEFNHGLSREKARRILKTDIVVMITQDAYAMNKYVLGKLVEPLLLQKASVSYGRQIPHEGADFFESFPREFNYPSNSHLRDIKDLPVFGVYTFFCSNSCAAYVNTALDEIGGFKHVLFGEDTLAVAELLHRGHKIAYVAEAVVKHSHSYTLLQEFRRHFDIGLSRRQIQPLLSCAGRDEKRGKHYLLSLSKKLLQESFYLLPYAYIQIFIKWVGYKLGINSVKSPNWFKKLLSSQRHYWE